MRVFIDTSTLIKKYKIESGRDRFLEILEKTTEIVVSAVTYIELFCSLKRHCEESHLSKKSFLKIKNEIDLDFGYFYKIPLNEDLERMAFDLRQKYQLKSLDLIQLASAKNSQSKMFLTSDKPLYRIASQEFKNHDVELIEP